VYARTQLSVFASVKDWRIARARRTATSSAPLGSKTASPRPAACPSARSKSDKWQTISLGMCADSWPGRYLVHATDATKASPEYEGGGAAPQEGAAGIADMFVEPVDEGHKPTTSPTMSPPPTHAPLGSAQAWRERHDVDSGDDEPDTEDEDNVVALPEPSDDEGDVKNGESWQSLFPLSASVKAMDQDLDHLTLEQSIKPEMDELMHKFELDPTAYTDSPMGMGAGPDDQKEFDPERYLSPFVAYFDTQLNASLNGLPESMASPKVRSQADKA
jgi:hypothetical protein